MILALQILLMLILQLNEAPLANHGIDSLKTIIHHATLEKAFEPSVFEENSVFEVNIVLAVYPYNESQNAIALLV